MENNHYVYFAVANKKGKKKLKVGYSHNPSGRMKQLEANHACGPVNLIGVFPFSQRKEAFRVEKEMHLVLKNYQHGNSREWFKYNAQVKNFVGSIFREGFYGK